VSRIVNLVLAIIAPVSTDSDASLHHREEKLTRHQLPLIFLAILFVLLFFHFPQSSSNLGDSFTWCTTNVTLARFILNCRRASAHEERPEAARVPTPSRCQHEEIVIGSGFNGHDDVPLTTIIVTVSRTC